MSAGTIRRTIPDMSSFPAGPRRWRLLAAGLCIALLSALLSAISAVTVPAAAAVGHDTATADIDYYRNINAPDQGMDHLSVNVSSLPSGEEPSGTFSVSCDRAEIGCSPYTGEVDCVNVQGSEVVLSGPVEGPDLPVGAYRTTMVLFDRSGDGDADGVAVLGTGGAANGTPGSADCRFDDTFEPYNLAESGDIAVHDEPGTTTPEGTGVTVTPAGQTDVGVTFDSVTEAGVTTLTTSNTAPAPPTFTLFSDPETYYDLETTATYTGAIQVCINFETTPEQYYRQRLYQYVDGAWADITDSLDPGMACGVTMSLSQFAIGYDGPIFHDTHGPDAHPYPDPFTNDYGWNRTNVRVDWNWVDDAAGIVGHCTDSSTSKGEGTAITLTATCTDRVGNQSTAHYVVKVDKTRPTISCPTTSLLSVGDSGILTADAFDALSGIDPALGTLSRTVKTNTVDSGTLTFRAFDLASNKSGPIDCPYTVLAGLGTVTAPEPGATLRKAAATISVTFTLTGADGPVAPAIARKLTDNGQIRVSLTGPSLTPASAACAWAPAKALFKCQLDTPPGLQTGVPYSLTVQERQVDGSTWWDAPGTGNPSTVSFR